MSGTMEHMIDKEKLKKRFNINSLRTNEKGCKLWSENDSDWYGSFRFGNKIVKAHRAAYILFIGDIPEGMHVCHTCDVKNCVNPDHLFIGTHRDNMIDMHSKGRWRTGNYGDHLKLSQAMADLIYWDSRSHQIISNEYGISRSLVSNIKNNRVWREREILSDFDKLRFRVMASKLC